MSLEVLTQGGSSKNVSAIVITGLKSTDTVTCVSGGKSYGATWDATNGRWEILKLPLGTFTVTATRGAETKTETVLIDIEGVYQIAISFILFLYKDGDMCEEVTGGWEKNSNLTLWTNCPSANGTVTFNDDSIYLNAGDFKSAVASTKNKVSVDGYSKMCAEFGAMNQASQQCAASATNSGSITWTAVIHSTQSNQTLDVDISDLSGEYYFNFASGNGRWCYYKKLWLE